MKITGFYLCPVRRISDADASVRDIVAPSVGILRVCRCRVPPPASSSPSPEADEVNFAQFSRISPAPAPAPPNKLVRNAPKLVQSVTISTQADLRTWEVL